MKKYGNSCGLKKYDGKYKNSAPQFLQTGLLLGTSGIFLGVKLKKVKRFFLQLRAAHKEYILKKKWVKTVIPTLTSGQSTSA